MAHSAEAKGHAGNGLMCSPQGGCLSLILLPFPDGLSRTSSSAPATPLCSVGVSITYPNEIIKDVFNLFIIKLAK